MRYSDEAEDDKNVYSDVEAEDDDDELSSSLSSGWGATFEMLPFE